MAGISDSCTLDILVRDITSQRPFLDDHCAKTFAWFLVSGYATDMNVHPTRIFRSRSSFQIEKIRSSIS